MDPSWEWNPAVSMRPPTTPSLNAMLTSVRTCTPTPSCLEAPPCTQVLLTECKRKSLPWIHLGFPLHLPTDVDHQARIRRMRPIHCPQKMLLSYISFLVILFSTCYSCCLT